MQEMTVALDREKGTITVTLPLYSKPVPSASGKTDVIASSRGNQSAGVKYDGREVVVGVNAYVRAR